MITRGTPTPPYLQLVAILRGKIESGELAPGQQLPSALTLASDYQVSAPTVKKALGVLKTRAWWWAWPVKGPLSRRSDRPPGRD